MMKVMARIPRIKEREAGMIPLTILNLRRRLIGRKCNAIVSRRSDCYFNNESNIRDKEKEQFSHTTNIDSYEVLLMANTHLA